MYSLYSVLVLLVAVIASPWFIYQAVRYKKYVRSRERYKAHDETNQYKVGDRVEIQEHRPISRDKRWLVTRLISRPVEE